MREEYGDLEGGGREDGGVLNKLDKSSHSGRLVGGDVGPRGGEEKEGGQMDGIV